MNQRGPRFVKAPKFRHAGAPSPLAHLKAAGRNDSGRETESCYAGDDILRQKDSMSLLCDATPPRLLAANAPERSVTRQIGHLGAFTKKTYQS